MIFVRVTAITLFIVLSASVTQAAVENCYGDSTQTDMNICAAKEAGKAKIELDAIYKKLEKTQEAQGIAALKDSKSKWEAFAESQCTFNTLGTEGGSIHSLVYSECLENLTRTQLKHVKENLSCEEGDMGCGGLSKPTE